MSKTVTFIRGISGLGKSTYAASLVDFETSEVVERDHFRHIHGVKNEREITRLQREQIIRHLEDEGMDHVVVSDTNLNPKFFDQFTTWAEDQGYEVDVVDMRGDNPVEALQSLHEAIQKDQKRKDNHVCERVIRNQFFKYVAPLFKYEGKHDGEPFIICDLDGTLADISHRSAYDTSDKILRDTPNELLVYMLTAMIQDMGIRILFFSGRKQKAFEPTYQWLTNLFDEDSFALHMRHDDDNRKDFIVKYEMFQGCVESVGGNVLAVFDDRPQVTDLWKTLGLPLYSLDKGVWF